MFGNAPGVSLFRIQISTFHIGVLQETGSSSYSITMIFTYVQHMVVKKVRDSRMLIIHWC